MRKLTPLVVVLAVLAAACGSSDGSKSSGSKSSGTTTSRAASTSSSTGTTAQTATKATAQDRRIATAGLVTAADVPAGFKGHAHEPDDSDDRDYDELVKRTPECAPFQALTKDNPDGLVKEHSRDFKQGVAELSSQTEVYATATEVTEQLAQLQQPGLDACLQELFRAAFTMQAGKPGAADSSKALRDAVITVTLLPGTYGDGTFGYSARIAFTVRGRAYVLYSDFVGVQVGQATLSVQTQSASESGAAEWRAETIPTLVDRMRSAGATG